MLFLTQNMDIIKENIRIGMIHNDLAKAPRYSLPERFSLRFCQQGDQKAWVDIHKEADQSNDIDLHKFEEVFSEHPLPLEERQLYLLNSDNEPIGTATAWEREREGSIRGLVHWVAIHPGYQGRGLAKPLLSATLSRLMELGYEDAFLYSSTARMPAINLYWKFGFRPLITDRKEVETWGRVTSRLHLK
jgi:ribosomal protein S18 acetylase RimI-like enzyme